MRKKSYLFHADAGDIRIVVREFDSGAVMVSIEDPKGIVENVWHRGIELGAADDTPSRT